MSDYQKRLERAIDRRLKALPLLAAPPGLLRSVIAALEERARLPWYARPMMGWPRALQAASFIVFLGLLGLVVFLTAHLSHAEMMTGSIHRAGLWLSGLGTLFRTVAVLSNAAGTMVKGAGLTIMLGYVLIAGLVYALCLALGTVYFRLGYARR